MSGKLLKMRVGKKTKVKGQLPPSMEHKQKKNKWKQKVRKVKFNRSASPYNEEPRT